LWKFGYFVAFTFPFFKGYAEATGGGFSTYLFPYLRVACLFSAVCLPRLCSLSLVSFSLPCLDAFFLLFLALSWRFWTIYIYIF
jgi:hypothetical protein